MKAVLLVVAVIAAVAFAQTIASTGDYCTGLNVTMHPGVQTVYSGAQTQRCPFGFYMDLVQGRCVSARTHVNNFYLAPCHQDTDCGYSSANPTYGVSYYAIPATSGPVLKCGRNKQCTWVATRAQNDTCEDNLNCISYSGRTVDGITLTIAHGCDVKTKTCQPIVDVKVPVGARCGYTNGTEKYVCNGQGTCRFPPTEVAVYGSGNCVPLLVQGELCTGAPRICGEGLVCTGAGGNPNNYTCTPSIKLGQTCYSSGNTFECDQSNGPAYCRRSTTGTLSCSTYQTAGQNCSSNPSTPGTNDKCASGLKCFITNPTAPPSSRYSVCYGPVSNNDTMGCTTGPTAGDYNTKPDCIVGQQCISVAASTAGSAYVGCFAGALNEPCNILDSNPLSYKDTCQWETGNLFCDVVNRNSTCQPRAPIGGLCYRLEQCQPGLDCYNQTCRAYQNLGDPCNELTTEPLQYLRCKPDLLCSRGVCINNYTVGINQLCSQDMDCDTAFCDPVMRRCTQRRLCNTGMTNCDCSCSSGPQNMGQCIMNNCGKQERDLLACVNPLLYDRYFKKWGSYKLSLGQGYALLDSQSSIYQKCSGQHSAWVRCQGLMNKWGTPSMPLGDLINYDLATISASSSVSVSIMVMVAFIMSAFMYL